MLVDGEVIMRGRGFTKVRKVEAWAELKAQLSLELTPLEVERKDFSRQILPYVHRFYQGWSMDEEKPHYFCNASD